MAESASGEHQSFERASKELRILGLKPRTDIDDVPVSCLGWLLANVSVSDAGE